MPGPMTDTSHPSETVALPRYGAQLAFVRFMLPILGGLLEAGSVVDPLVQREVESLPDGLVFGMTVFGTDARIRLTRREGRFVQLDPATAPPPTLDIVFKHVSVAFLVVSFQESTALAFARDIGDQHDVDCIADGNLQDADAANFDLAAKCLRGRCAKT